MLCVFAGYPPNVSFTTQRLIGHAGAVRGFVIQNDIGLLESRPVIQWRKDGVYIVHEGGEEQVAESHFVVSPALQSVRFHPKNVTGIDSGLPDSFTLGNTITCNARAGLAATLLLLDPLRDPLHTNPDKPGRVTNFQAPKWRKNIWISWVTFSHTIPYFAYVKLLYFMEGEDTMVPSKGDYDAMLPSRALMIPSPGARRFYGAANGH